MSQRWSSNLTRILVGCLLTIAIAVATLWLDPTPTPAADTAGVAITPPATPVPAESPVTEEDACPVEGVPEVVTVVDGDTFATPVATGEEPEFACREPGVTEPDPETPVAEPVTEATEEIAFETASPTPERAMADPADPYLAGLPWQDGAAPVAGDPMLSGLDADRAVEASSIDDIAIEILAAEGIVTPGGQITYRFRFLNSGGQPVTARIVAATDGAGWSAEVRWPDGGGPVVEPQLFRPGVAVELLVVVTASEEAVAGESASTTITLVAA